MTIIIYSVLEDESWDDSTLLRPIPMVRNSTPYMRSYDINNISSMKTLCRRNYKE